MAFALGVVAVAFGLVGITTHYERGSKNDTAMLRGIAVAAMGLALAAAFWAGRIS